MAPPLEHVDGDAKEDEAAGDLKGRQADAEEGDDKPARQGKDGQNEEGIDAGLAGHLPGVGGRTICGQGQIGKDIAQRVENHEQRNQAGDKHGPDGTQEVVNHGERLPQEKGGLWPIFR